MDIKIQQEYYDGNLFEQQVNLFSILWLKDKVKENCLNGQLVILTVRAMFLTSYVSYAMENGCTDAALNALIWIITYLDFDILL